MEEATTFARKGYVTASIDYRLATTGCVGNVTASCVQGIVDAQHDAQAAVRFLRAHAADYGIDPGRIAVGGSSAGAITALNVGYSPNEVGTSGTPGVSSRVQAAISLSGARLITRPDRGEAPPCCSTAPPTAWSPTSGPRTPCGRRRAGLVAELTTWQGAGHVPYGAHRQEILDQTTNFLWWNLDLPHAPTS